LLLLLLFYRFVNGLGLKWALVSEARGGIE